MPSLSLEPVTSAASLNANGRLLTNVFGGSAVAVASTTGTRTGLHQLRSGGGDAGANSGATGTAVTTTSPAPTGHGFFWEVTTLDSAILLPGSVQPTVATQATASTMAGKVYCRFFKYSTTALTYTPIQVWGQSATATFSLTANGRLLNAASIPATEFGPTDRLYVDFWVDVTTAGALGNSTVSLIENGAAGPNVTTLVTAGYDYMAPQSILLGGRLGRRMAGVSQAIQSGIR